LSHNLTPPGSTAAWVSAITGTDWSAKSVLVIGAGWMADQYAKALTAMGIADIGFISRSAESAPRLAETYGGTAYTGGFEKQLPDLPPYDLVIVASSVLMLVEATSLALEHGQTNILIEKPGALYPELLESLAHVVNGHQVRIAFNRVVYPNYLLLKELTDAEGGITSCMYTFTEWVHTIDFDKDEPEVYRRWGVGNSLHLISMAHDLIGKPAELATHQSGGLSWHPAGAIFTGSGMSDRGIPFSYHADWTSAGRWGIQVMTLENAYLLRPLETLKRCRKGTVTWEEMPFPIAYTEAKFGVAEELAAMLEPNLAGTPPLLTVDEVTAYIKLAERIFGYNPRSSYHG